MEKKSLFVNTVESSQFLTRLCNIPLVHSTISVVSDYYGQAKNSGGIVGKTIGVAEMTASVAAGQVLPYAQKLTPFAAQPLSKVDDLANKGLEKLETNVPVIMKQPQEIVSDTRELIHSKVTPAVETINSVSEMVLGTKVAQFSMDCYEQCLKAATEVVDYILPPNENEKTQQNGFHYDNTVNEEKSRRIGYLFHRSVYLITVTSRRLLGLAQSRVDSAVTATDSVVNSARKSLNNILPKAQNGDAKPTAGHKTKNKTKTPAAPAQ